MNRQTGQALEKSPTMRGDLDGDYADLEAPVTIGPSWRGTVSVEALFVEPLKP